MTSDDSIVTARLLLRPLALSDASDVFSYASDPEVARYTSWPAHRRVEDSEAFAAAVVAVDSTRPGAFRRTWGIRLLGDQSVVGTIDLVQDDPQVGHTDFALARPLWGHGYMTEAVRSVVRLAFDRLGLERIHSGGLTINVGSGRVLEKAGFRPVSRQMIRFGEKFGHVLLEVSHYELLRTDYKPGPELTQVR